MKILSGHWTAGSSGPVPRCAHVLGIQLPDSWSIEVCAGSGCKKWGGKQVVGHWSLGTLKRLVEDESPPACRVACKCPAGCNARTQVCWATQHNI